MNFIYVNDDIVSVKNIQFIKFGKNSFTICYNNNTTYISMYLCENEIEEIKKIFKNLLTNK